MGQEQLVPIEAFFKHLSIGIAILDGVNLRVRYLNPYVATLLEEHWSVRDVVGKRIEELLPEKIHKRVFARLQQVMETGEESTYKELPYESFEQTRGRTYWNVSIKKVQELASLHDALLITIEDVTESVRSRLQLQAIQYVSVAMGDTHALPMVLDRILEVISQFIDVTACAVLLIDHTISGYDALQNVPTPRKCRVTLAAQKGIHISAQDWHPMLDEHILFGRVEQQKQVEKIGDTSLFADVNLPHIDRHGNPHRPASVVSVPIFEPHAPTNFDGTELRIQQKKLTGRETIFGSIEMYSVKVRNFSFIDIHLLEQLALQAGVAIQNARLFRKLEKLIHVERRKAHQQKYVMQAMPDGVIIFDPRWRVAEANSAIYTLLGWSDNVIGLPITQALKQSTAIFFEDIVHLEALIPELERRAREGIVNEFKMIGANKKTYIIRCTYTPIQDEIGDIFAFIVVYHDVTEQVEARERIEAEVVERTKELAQRNMALQLAKVAQETERSRLELLLERLPSGVLLVSAQDNSIITINQHAIQLLQRLGMPPEMDGTGIVGQNAEYLLRPIKMYDASDTFLPQNKRPLYIALKNGKANEAELHMQDRDGKTIYIFASAAPLRTGDGTISSAVFVYSEITTIKKLEQARDDFFTTMAHELKTPLANVRAQLSALLAQDVQWSHEEQYAALQMADEQVERLISAVNRTLEASRIEVGALHPRLETVLLPELFEDLEERLAALIASSHHSLRIVYPKALPAVRADYELIMSVLMNLLSNAFRYVPEGDSVLLEAKATFAPQDILQRYPLGVNLCVSDNGPGISQEQQKLLFTRFSTLATTNRAKQNHTGQAHREREAKNSTTGLGLYISRGIVEAHGSKLTLISSPGHGASFAFTLPVAAEIIHVY